MTNTTTILHVLGLLALGTTAASAQVSITTTGSNVYTQNFNSLATSGSNNVWTDNVTLVGWYAAGFDGTYRAATSTSNGSARDLYSFGNPSNTADRALGALNGGNGAPIYFGVQLVNSTGAAIDSLTASIQAEKYMQPGGNDTTTAAYGLGLSSLTSGTWTSVPALNVSSSVVGQNLSLTLSNLGWAPSQSLWFRWTDVNSSGNDRSLAIDNFALSVNPGTAIPEPSTYALLLGLGTVGLAAVRRWRKHRVA